MKISELDLKGSFVVEPIIFSDIRGGFFESFNQQKFEGAIGEKVNFVQDNQSISRKGVIRGLHYQEGKYAQAKLVRVVKGRVLDVILDLRKNSKTYGEYHSVVLSAENGKQVFVPKGFAHGFSVLENNTIFAYKCDNYYHKKSERGIKYNDPDLKIDWKLEKEEIIVSEKDKELSFLKELRHIK